MGARSIAGALTGVEGSRKVGLGQGAVPVAGAAAGCLGLAAGLALNGPAATVASTLLAAIMGAIAAEDIRAFRVPNTFNLVAAIAGAAAAWIGVGASLGAGVPALMDAGLGALLCGGALFALREAFFRLRGADGLGMGDVKLGAVGGLWLGWQSFAVAMLFAAVGALVFVAARTALRGPWQRTQRIPFALYLAPAIWVVWYGARLFPPM